MFPLNCNCNQPVLFKVMPSCNGQLCFQSFPEVLCSLAVFELSFSEDGEGTSTLRGASYDLVENLTCFQPSALLSSTSPTRPGWRSVAAPHTLSLRAQAQSLDMVVTTAGFRKVEMRREVSRSASQLLACPLLESLWSHWCQGDGQRVPDVSRHPGAGRAARCSAVVVCYFDLNILKSSHSYQQ